MEVLDAVPLSATGPHLGELAWQRTEQRGERNEEARRGTAEGPRADGRSFQSAMTLARISIRDGLRSGSELPPRPRGEPRGVGKARLAGRVWSGGLPELRLGGLSLAVVVVRDCCHPGAGFFNTGRDHRGRTLPGGTRNGG